MVQKRGKISFFKTLLKNIVFYIDFLLGVLTLETIKKPVLTVLRKRVFTTKNQRCSIPINT